MNANDVYNIAKALPPEELMKLYKMIKGDIKVVKPTLKTKSKRKPLPDFTLEDSVKYLIENHFNEKKTA
ncbi:hypothetical protein [Bizionia paragorgiae]|jgi:hypothetical protein|uniref:hypothetical protein n=1 Tax=Bizionia paragorgiae TaxID=283786 RepID=UPI001B74C65E|nr:hypothetical protein [Bizionia paragorgiae]MBQ0768009.1 hypothetical protein [Bizionia sp.]MDX1271922.1 hypothetical protein [Bizionia paragorgiae]